MEIITITKVLTESNMQFNYFPNVPNAPDDPADDQPEMQVNTLSIYNLIGVDHVGFNNSFNAIANSGGFHTVIHMTQQNAAPGAIGTIGQLWSQLATFNGVTDQALFFESGNGSITQLTTPGGTSLNRNGFVFLPGGILMQWGRANPPFPISVTFSPSFSATAYNIQLTPAANSGSVSATIQSGTISNTGFNIEVASVGSPTISSIHWLAIGPA
jgi:hypothetical protein